MLPSIPEALEREIEATARDHGESLNKAVLRLLRKAAGLDQPDRHKRDLTSFAGTWAQEEADEFARDIAVFDAVEDEMWQ